MSDLIVVLFPSQVTMVFNRRVGTVAMVEDSAGPSITSWGLQPQTLPPEGYYETVNYSLNADSHHGRGLHEPYHSKRAYVLPYAC